MLVLCGIEAALCSLSCQFYKKPYSKSALFQIRLKCPASPLSSAAPNVLKPQDRNQPSSWVRTNNFDTKNGLSLGCASTVSTREGAPPPCAHPYYGRPQEWQGEQSQNFFDTTIHIKGVKEGKFQNRPTAPPPLVQARVYPGGSRREGVPHQL